MSKRTLHLSDPRPHMVQPKLAVDRLALNFRVIVKVSEHGER